MSGVDRPRRVGLATARDAWSHDEDAQVLGAALDAFGVQHGPAVWDDPEVDWAGFDLVVVRSTWDYTARREEFLAWADSVESVTRLANPASVLRWNTDKRYLGELAAAGVRVVPTTYLLAEEDRGPVDPFVVSDHGGDIVVKPTVSAGSQDTARYAPADAAAAAAHARALLDAGRDVMVQPYLHRVDQVGETGMVVLSGELSHGFAKAALLRGGTADVDGLFAPEQITPRVPGADEVELAFRTLEAATAILGVDRLLYARVDVLPDDDGRPSLLELELTEPSWFLEQSPGAAERAAACILAAAST
ncbi:MAG: RimK family alpha-L-glutamate ligase [Microthrixaceae bacterium]